LKDYELIGNEQDNVKEEKRLKNETKGTKVTKIMKK
jgi:hypothetical protein